MSSSASQTDSTITVAVLPERDQHITAALDDVGATQTDLDAARVLIWLGGASGFPDLPDTVEWVALKTAGIVVANPARSSRRSANLKRSESMLRHTSSRSTTYAGRGRHAFRSLQRPERMTSRRTPCQTVPDPSAPA